MSTQECQRSVQSSKWYNIQELFEVIEISYNLRDPTRTSIHQSNSTTCGLILLKIEYHAIGDTWWQPLLSYDK